MRKGVVAFCMITCCFGCSHEVEPTHRKSEPAYHWEPAQATHVQEERLGQVSNSGLLLPVVSPDGQWIAYLQQEGNQPVGPDALFTGKDLWGVSLHVRAIQTNAPARLVCAAGAAWPTWSADSRQLAFVVYGNTERCNLAVYNVASGDIHRKSLGFKRIMMPAFSPSGKQVALIAAEKEPGKPQLYVLTLDNSLLKPCPVEDPDTQHLWPQWTGDGRIVHVLIQGTRTSIAQWRMGEFGPEKLCEIPLPASRIAAFQAFAGLGRPLSPNGRRFAYYNPLSDNVVLVNLQDGKQTQLRTKTRSGCWLDSRRFVAATDEEMLLFPAGNKPIRLRSGPWLPRGSVNNTNQLILCTQGPHPGVFTLVRMKVIAAR